MASWPWRVVLDGRDREGGGAGAGVTEAAFPPSPRHVFINMALLHCVTLILFFDVFHDLPSSEPSMEYWPSGSFPLALPYVMIRKPLKWC